MKKTKAKEKRDDRQKAKTKGQWAKEAQAAFNRFIRVRDADKFCVSCGRSHAGQYHAGHYFSVGAKPELRFSELNVHKQCSACNNYLSGNIALYRKELLNRIGPAALEWLEGPHEPKHYTIEDLKEIKQHYSKLARELEKKNAS